VNYRRALPATGALALLVTLAGASTAMAAASTSTCVGAAARDPHHPCTNLSRTVSPQKGDDALYPSTFDCKATLQRPRPVCTFGAPLRGSKATVALVGDSHALHWRAALDIVAKAKRWRAFSMTTAACQFSAVKFVEAFRALCRPWYAQARRWFADHPQVSTVFVSQKTITLVAPVPGKTEAQARAAGFVRAWSTLPKTVKRIIVLRDVPNPLDGIFSCIDEAVATGMPALSVACPSPREGSLLPDAAVAAAHALRSRRYRVIDLSSLFCTWRQCFPVIGGVQVYADVVGHITAAYMRTVAPFLLRRLGG